MWSVVSEGSIIWPVQFHYISRPISSMKVAGMQVLMKMWIRTDSFAYGLARADRAIMSIAQHVDAMGTLYMKIWSISSWYIPYGTTKSPQYPMISFINWKSLRRWHSWSTPWREFHIDRILHVQTTVASATYLWYITPIRPNCSKVWSPRHSHIFL